MFFSSNGTLVLFAEHFDHIEVSLFYIAYSIKYFTYNLKILTKKPKIFVEVRLCYPVGTHYPVSNNVGYN